MLVGLLPLLPISACAPRESAVPVASVAANDNRHAAGTMRGDTLFVDLELRQGRWYPDSIGGEYVDLPVLGEVGKAPQVPGPLIRVVEGTVISARVTNALRDSTVKWTGLNAKPGLDSFTVKPGETKTVQFVAGRPGTYWYGARAGVTDPAKQGEREQSLAAFVIDAKGARTDDRIFVLNIWSAPIDSVNWRNALAINGHEWPYTERVAATAGDTLRWRIVNATIRPHPMHLHGFYFTVDARGDGVRDSVVPVEERAPEVTELVPPFGTFTVKFVAEREGHWLFHCHLSFHVAPETRFSPAVLATNPLHTEHSTGDVARHMAGLILGIDVAANPSIVAAARPNPRALRLLVNEGHRRGRAPRALGFVLQQGREPARDSVEISGTPLILTRGQPTDITVVNRLKEATAVHWHGIELESYSDGVAGWSGSGTHVAPVIAPADSFTAHLTLPRAGTFIYHTHLNDIEQLTSGMYGPIVVLEPGQKFDARTDHLFVVGWDGAADPPHLLVNGDSLPAPLTLAAGVHHRLRFVFIGVVGGETFTLRSSTGLARWRQVARDGAELSAAAQHDGPAKVQGWAGQTADFDFLPPARGEYRLIVGDSLKPSWSRRVIVR